MKEKFRRSVLIFESTKPYNPTSGGSYYSLRPIISAFCDQGWDVKVTSYVENSLLNFPEYKNLENVILKHFSLKHYLRKTKSNPYKKKSNRANNNFFKVLKSSIFILYSTFFTVINSFYLATVLHKYKPDFVYCNTGIVNDRAMVLASIFSRVKVICHLRNLPNLSKIDKFLAEKVTAAVFISQTVLNHYTESDILFKSQLVRHNALGKNFDSQPFKIGKNVFLSGEDFRMACFMRLIKWKGGSTLLNAFYNYRNNGGKGKLFIYGDGPERNNLEKETKSLNLEKFVKFLGHTEDVINEIGSSSLIIAPSDKPEPLGRTVMEAKRLGIPIIASNAGGFKETINHNFDGLHYDIMSHHSLSEMMLKVFLNLELREKFVKKSLQQSKSWSVNNYQNGLLKFLEKNI